MIGQLEKQIDKLEKSIKSQIRQTPTLRKKTQPV